MIRIQTFHHPCTEFDTRTPDYPASITETPEYRLSIMFGRTATHCLPHTPLTVISISSLIRDLSCGVLSCEPLVSWRGKYRQLLSFLNILPAVGLEYPLDLCGDDDLKDLFNLKD